MPPVLPAYLIARWLLLIVLAASVYFLSGFIIPGAAALIIGLATWPLYQRLVNKCRGNTTLAAGLAIALIVFVLLVPLALALMYSIKEASSLFAWLLAVNRHGLPVPAWIAALPVGADNLADMWRQYLGEPHALGAVVEMISGEHLGNIYRMVLAATGNAFRVCLAVLFMLLTLFFVYKDGTKLLAQLDMLGERVLPARWQRFSRVVPATIGATVTGMGMIALGEGALLGTAYWIARVPSPVLLGVITGFMALVPGGAPLSFTLVSLYLCASGHFVTALALMAWGSLELFVVDKTLRPRLVGGPVKLPFLPTFFGLVGGVTTMGIVGLFIGPVLMSLLVAVWREWVRSVRELPEPGVHRRRLAAFRGRSPD